VFSHGFHNDNTVFLLEGQFGNANAQNAYLQVSDNYTITECCLAIYFEAKVDTALPTEAWVHFTAVFLT